MSKKSLDDKIKERAGKMNTISPSEALYGDIETDDDNNGTEVSDDSIDVRGADEGVQPKSEKSTLTKDDLSIFESVKVEDTHKRATFLIKKDTLKQIDKLAKNRHGFKTKLINHLLEEFLNGLNQK